MLSKLLVLVQNLVELLALFDFCDESVHLLKQELRVILNLEHAVELPLKSMIDLFLHPGGFTGLELEFSQFEFALFD